MQRDVFFCLVTHASNVYILSDLIDVCSTRVHASAGLDFPSIVVR